MDKPKVVLGVSGGIAAYKACELLRRLTESGHDVRVVPTASALHFVGAATWAALSGHPVTTDVWDDVHEVPHVRIGQHADLVVVAPATADMLAKAAHGLADDLLTNTLLTARCPVVFAPAMHTEMWEHPATQENVATLRRRGAVVIEPAVGRLTGADTGKGRLPDPGGDLRGLPPGAGPRAVTRARPGRPARRGQRRRHPRAARPGPLPRQPLLRQAGLRPGPHRRRPRRPGHAGRGQHRPARPGGRRRRPGRDGRAAARGRAQGRRRRRRGGDGRRRRRLPARDATRPERSRRRTARSPTRSSSCAIRTSSRSCPPTGARRRPGGRRVRRRDRRRPRQRPDEAARARAATCSSSTRSGERRTFGSEENAAVVLGADGSETPVPHGPKEALADIVWDLVARRLS